MSKPKITFFCELDAAALVELFSDPAIIEDLNYLDAAISLGILDFTPERAAVVKRLNDAGVPVTAWLLLPREEGYWFNMKNAPQAADCYQAFKEWTAHYKLSWDCIGLDIEPDIQEMSALAKKRREIAPVILRRLFSDGVLLHARSAYNALVNRIGHDGYKVESYHFPLMIDERKAGSSLIQRLMGVVDFPTDREVFMLYSSFLRPDGAGVLWNYAPETRAVGIGNTGGGVEISGEINPPPLSWQEFRRDLLLARHMNKTIYVFCLEGCVKQGFLTLLKNFNWEQPVDLPQASANKVARIRRWLRVVLWLSAHPLLLVVCLLALSILLLRPHDKHRK